MSSVETNVYFQSLTSEVFLLILCIQALRGFLKAFKDLRHKLYTFNFLQMLYKNFYNHRKHLKIDENF